MKFTLRFHCNIRREAGLRGGEGKGRGEGKRGIGVHGRKEVEREGNGRLRQGYSIPPSLLLPFPSSTPSPPPRLPITYLMIFYYLLLYDYVCLSVCMYVCI